MHSQVVTNTLSTEEKNNKLQCVIYLFPHADNALRFANCIKSITENVTVSVNENCFIGVGQNSVLDTLMDNINTFFESYNARIIKGSQPGWIAHYHNHRNFGCLGIKRQESVLFDSIISGCEEINWLHGNHSNDAAFEKTLTNPIIAKHMLQSLSTDSHSSQLSLDLISGWLDEADKHLIPSSLISPKYFSDSFIDPISIANKLHDIRTLKQSIEAFIASRQHNKYITADDLIQFFAQNMDRCCMISENECHEIAFLLSSTYMELKSKQLKQQLIRHFSTLCDTGEVNETDIEEAAIKFLRYKKSN